MQHTSNRQTYLDWLRIMAIFGVLVFHAAMPFVSEWEWHIKNGQTSQLLQEMNFWMSRFRMPLLFFISGSVSYYMLQKKTTGGFIAVRFRRLFIPLLFGMLVIVPPQIYLERVAQGYRGSYWDFYPSVLLFKPYPAGNFSWHHLWFICYLLVYDIVCAPLLKWIVGAGGQRFLQRCNVLARAQWIYVLIIPSVLLYCWLNLKFPATHDLINDWFRLPYWLLFLLVGFVCIAHAPFMNSLERNRRLSLGLAFSVFLVMNYFRWNGLEPFEVIDARTYVYMSLYPMAAWFAVFALIGYGRRYLNKSHPVLNYLNQAVYPFYILHQTAIVIVSFYVVQVNELILAKYLFTVVVSFIASVLVYHIFVRPYAVTRLLFGMKPAPTKKKTIEVAIPSVQLS
jgi:Predicted acyltransferases